MFPKLPRYSLVILTLSGCVTNDEVKLNPVGQHSEPVMPHINQGISPAQRRAIMSGEQPDWSDVYPQRINKNSSAIRK